MAYPHWHLLHLDVILKVHFQEEIMPQFASHFIFAKILLFKKWVVDKTVVLESSMKYAVKINVKLWKVEFEKKKMKSKLRLYEATPNSSLKLIHKTHGFISKIKCLTSSKVSKLNLNLKPHQLPD